MHLKSYFIHFLLIALYIYIFLMVFQSSRKVGKPLKVRRLSASQAVYCIKNNGRYFYYNLMDKVIFVRGFKLPNVPLVIFNDHEDLKLQKAIIKKIYLTNDLLKVDFLRKEIFCYNRIKIKFHEVNDIKKAYEQGEFEGLNPGEYNLINDTIFLDK